MGQIVSAAAKPKRCNANQLSQVPTPAAGEHILVSSDNSMNAAGQGNFDCYIVGDGTTAATALPLIKTYANDVDDEPTAGSEKLVKSGGVESILYHQTFSQDVAAKASGQTRIALREFDYGTKVAVRIVSNTATLASATKISVGMRKTNNSSIYKDISTAWAVFETTEALPFNRIYAYISGEITQAGTVTLELIFKDAFNANIGFANTVQVVEQSLTTAQQNQAKANIGLPPEIDDEPTAGSNNLVESGGVYDADRDLCLQANKIDLSVNGVFNITGKGSNLNRINGLSFKAGVTYICTHTNNVLTASCIIYDADNTAICGLTLVGDALSRTNQFTPSSDIENGYVTFGGDNYTLSILASSSLKNDVKELEDKTKDLSNICEKKVDISSKNEFKIGDVLESTLLTNNGDASPNPTYAAYTTCDFVVAESNTTYCTTVGQNLRAVCFYDADKNIPCLGYANNVNSFTTPANTAYIRFSVKNEWLDTTSIVKTSVPIPFSPYNPVENYITGKVDVNGKLSDNVLDKNATILYNTFMFNNGVLLESDSYCTLDFFEVEPNQYYSCSKECGTFRKVCCFDEDKHFISDGSGFVENISTFVTPSNCKYVRISLPIAYFNNFMLVKGVTPLPYHPYNPTQGYLNHDTFSYKNIEKIKEFTLKEWSKLQFGMFIHWGVYSAWAGKYDGLDIDGNEIHRTDGTEWMWWSFKIPKETYKAKVSDFSSNGWNPELLCKLAKSVGMEYIVLTIRHHEGFSLIPTSYCEWDITSSSASADTVMQLKNACDKYHIKFCVYISALLDWNDYGGFGQERWHENVDPYTEKEHVSFASQQADYCRQIVDIYKPYLIWFDGGTYISQPNSVREVFTQKQMAYFPFEITNDRGSQKSYDWLEKEDMYADEPNYTGYLERCYHIAGWGYNEANDTPNISKVVNNRIWDIFEAVGRGFNYLLNVPPKGDGSISDNYINWFKELSSFCRKYTYFNGAKRLFNNCQPNWGRPMYIGNSIYMLVLPGNGSNVYVDSIDTENLIGVHVYNIESPDSAANYEIISDDRLLVKNVPVHSASLNPENVTPEEYFSVVRLDFNGPVWCGDYNYVDTSINTVSIVRVSSKSWPELSTGIRFNSKRYFIGEDNSVSRTRFKYVGTTGTKSINFTIEATGTNSVSAEFIDETAGTTQTVTLSNDALSGVTLTNGHIYTMNISKNGSGNLKISNVISIGG